ncbi:MAG: iron ABC transporter permease [Oligoflexales bacterium]|nr:iron ABC transporter permease [Oligoflexales bacterium]
MRPESVLPTSILKSPQIYIVIFAILVFFLSLFYGVVDLDIFSIIMTDAKMTSYLFSNTNDSFILFQVRVPRIFSALLAGACLAAGGVLSQGLFRNELASPSILGTSAGAAFFASLAFYFAWAQSHFLAVAGSAFLGALLATFILLTLLTGVHYTRYSFYLLLGGFALSSFLGALSSFIVSFLMREQIQALAVMRWLLGSFNSSTLEQVQFALPLAILAFIFSLKISRALNILALGEDSAGNLSIDIKKLQVLSLLLIAFLTAIAAGLGGIIPFVGLVAPHLTRLILGPEHRQLLIYSSINGASLLVLADWFGRVVNPPYELQVGIITSLLGAPFFLLLIRRQLRQSREAT